MELISLDKEFDRIWNKIKNGENITVLRYGDGERAIMTGRKVIAQEGWVSPEGSISSLGHALLNTLNIDNERFIYGISCPCCDSAAYYWYKTRIKSKNTTFANLFININYQRFIKSFEELTRDAIYIGNHRGNNSKIGNLNILKYYLVSDDCFSFWEKEAENLITEIKKDFGDKNNLLYVVSAGPMSEPIIKELFKNNPNNCYIDFGSSIDKYIHKKQTRPYEDKNSVYAKRNCSMPAPETQFDVSAVLTLYKRPQNLKPQLEALINQTLKPKEILLYQDGTGDTIKIPEEIKNEFNIIQISPENKGVWERFRFAMNNATSKYVCIFDDDTIPGKRYLENCITEMQKQKGLYCAIGILTKDEQYKNETIQRFGWAAPNEETIKVDFGGHSWFCEKEWLNYLFEDTEELQKYKVCAEDMSFSMKLQLHNIPTFVPPQPKYSPDFIGSTKGNELGSDKESLFLTNGWEKMSQVFERLIKEYNFKTVEKTDKKYFKKVFKPSLFQIILLNLKYLQRKYKTFDLFLTFLSKIKRKIIKN